MEELDYSKLTVPLPDEAITKHPTKTYLSSIKAIYVTERFNEVFWVGKWTTKVEFVENAGNGMIVVKVIFEVPERWIYYESFGGNDNGWESNKNFDLWDAYKWATTDALTKIGSYMGVWIDVFKWKASPWRTTHAQKVAKQAAVSREINKGDFSQKELIEWIEEFREEKDVNHLATLWKEFSKFQWSEKQLNWATKEKDEAKDKLMRG